MYSVFPAAVAVLFLGYGLYVLKKTGLNRLSLCFFILCGTTFAWQFTWAVLFQVQDAALAQILARIGYLFILFLPTSLYHYLAEMAGRRDEEKWIVISYLLAAILAVVLLHTNLFVAGTHNYFMGYYPKAGVLHPLHVLQTLVVVLRGLYLVWHAQEQANPRMRIRLRYCGVALLIYLFAALDYLCNYGLEFYPPGVFFILVSLGLLALATVRHQLMDVSIVVSMGLARVVVLGVFSLAWAGAYFTLAMPFPDPIRFYVSAGLAVAMAVLIGESYRPMWQFFQGLPARMMGTDWRLHQSAEVISAVTQAITRHARLDEMMRDFDRAMTNSSRLRVVQFFLRVDLSDAPVGFQNDQYVLWDVRRGVANYRKSILTTHPLLRRLDSTELVHYQELDNGAALLLEDSGALSALAVKLDGQLVGALLIGLENGAVNYTGAELDLLELLPGQLSLGFGCIQAYTSLLNTLDRHEDTDSVLSLVREYEERMRQSINVMHMYGQARIESETLRDEVRARCEQVLRVMDEMRDNLRKRGRRTERVLDLNAILRSATRLFPLRGRTVHLDLDPQLPATTGDSDDLLILFLGILRCVGETVPPGGGPKVLVHTRRRRDIAALEVKVESVSPFARCARDQIESNEERAWQRGNVDIRAIQRIIAEHGGEVREIIFSNDKACFEIRLPLAGENVVPVAVGAV